MILTALNTVALVFGYIAFFIILMWLLGQFIIWIREGKKADRRREFENELEQVAASLSSTCAQEYPEVQQTCSIVVGRMKGEKTQTPGQFLTWLRRYHPKM